MSFARVTIVGNLGGDPESRYLESGTLVVNFSMAASGRKKDSGSTWFRVSAFGEVAERLANMVERGYIKKGSLLYVEGAFEVREYTANDGTIRTSNDVNLSDWQFVGGSKQGDSQQNSQGDYQEDQSRGTNYDEIPF